MQKVPQPDKQLKPYRLGSTSNDPKTKSHINVSHQETTCITGSEYGRPHEGLDLSFLRYAPNNIGHTETEEDFSIWFKDLCSACFKKTVILNETTKEISDRLLALEAEKEKNKTKAKKRMNEKSAYAKKQALKARRREFASQRARLMLLMLDDGQDYICANCGTEENLTVDHIYPVSKGGTDELSNLAFLCQSCNSSKGTKVINDAT